MEIDTVTQSMKNLTIELRRLIDILQMQDKPTVHPPNDLVHYSIEEASEILHCHPNSVRSILKENEIKIFRYKGLVRIRKLHLERFITRNTI